MNDIVKDTYEKYIKGKDDEDIKLFIKRFNDVKLSCYNEYGVESHQLLCESVEFIYSLQESVDEYNFPILASDEIESLMEKYSELNRNIEDSAMISFYESQELNDE